MLHLTCWSQLWCQFYPILWSFKNRIRWKKIKVTGLIGVCISGAATTITHKITSGSTSVCTRPSVSYSTKAAILLFFVILWTSVMCSAVMGLSFWQCRSITFAWVTEMCVVLKLHCDNDIKSRKKSQKKLKLHWVNKKNSKKKCLNKGNLLWINILWRY